MENRAVAPRTAFQLSPSKSSSRWKKKPLRMNCCSRAQTAYINAWTTGERTPYSCFSVPASQAVKRIDDAVIAAIAMTASEPRKRFGAIPMSLGFGRAMTVSRMMIRAAARDQFLCTEPSVHNAISIAPYAIASCVHSHHLGTDLDCAPELTANVLGR